MDRVCLRQLLAYRIKIAKQTLRSNSCHLDHDDALEITIVLPARQGHDTVDAAHLMAARTHVVENGLLEAAAFDALLRGAEPTAASQ